jgi:pimeloyl-ACP methyl ester carboxylesterase
MIPASHAHSVESSFPDCHVEIFDGAGHFPHLEDPDRFARLLRDFIAADQAEG